MTKIRHIAYRAEDTEAMARFFVEGFGLAVVQRRSSGVIDLSDGDLNISLLPMSIPRQDGEAPQVGIEHIGFTAEDEAAARALVAGAGGAELGALELGIPVNFEVKFRGPEGIMVDIGHWAGTSPLDETVRTSSGVAHLSH